MHRVREIVARGWTGAAAGTVRLAFDARYRRRARLDVEGVGAVLLDLARPRVLQDGEALRLDDGRLIRIEAAAEPLLEVRAGTPALLMRLAWHIGNRHLPAQIEADRILIRPDHVIAAMLHGLGGAVRAVEAPFDPEGGAYAGPGAHAHADGAAAGHGHRHDGAAGAHDAGHHHD
jgi:urease accessory protein